MSFVWRLAPCIGPDARRQTQDDKEPSRPSRSTLNPITFHEHSPYFPYSPISPLRTTRRSRPRRSLRRRVRRRLRDRERRDVPPAAPALRAGPAGARLDGGAGRARRRRVEPRARRDARRALLARQRRGPALRPRPPLALQPARVLRARMGLPRLRAHAREALGAGGLRGRGETSARCCSSRRSRARCAS